MIRRFVPGSVHPSFKIFTLLHRCKRCCPTALVASDRNTGCWLVNSQQVVLDATLRARSLWRQNVGLYSFIPYSQHGLMASTHMFCGWFEIFVFVIFCYCRSEHGLIAFPPASASDYILDVRARFCSETVNATTVTCAAVQHAHICLVLFSSSLPWKRSSWSPPCEDHCEISFLFFIYVHYCFQIHYIILCL